MSVCLRHTFNDYKTSVWSRDIDTQTGHQMQATNEQLKTCHAWLTANLLQAFSQKSQENE